jgi:Domain of unknown function (DUF4288)
MLKLPCGMNWYLIKLIYQIVIGDGPHVPQFDVQLRLISADDPDWALEKAEIVGRIGASSFINASNEQVRRTFIAVEDVRKIGDLEDGAELYAQIIEPDNMAEYLKLTVSKARRLVEAHSAGVRNTAL